jgi:hypothetical protein
VDIGKRLRELREAKALSQGDVEDRTGLPRTPEQGKRRRRKSRDDQESGAGAPGGLLSLIQSPLVRTKAWPSSPSGSGERLPLRQFP